MQRAMYAVGVLGIALICGGCVAAVIGLGATAGVGAFTYAKGEVTTTYSVPLEEAWDASVTAIRTMQFPIDRQNVDALGGEIAAHRADGKPVKVTLKPLGDYSTDIAVRIGGIESMWSREDAQQVHNTIQRNLNASQS